MFPCFYPCLYNLVSPRAARDILFKDTILPKMLQWLSTAFKTKSNPAPIIWVLLPKLTSVSFYISLIHSFTVLQSNLPFSSSKGQASWAFAIVLTLLCAPPSPAPFHPSKLRWNGISTESLEVSSTELSHHLVFSIAFAVICNYLVYWFSWHYLSFSTPILHIQ